MIVAALGLPIPKLIIEIPSAVAVGIGRFGSTTSAPVNTQNVSR